MTPVELLADPWAFGPWCWCIDEVRLFDRPRPARGMQGLWPLGEADWFACNNLALGLDPSTRLRHADGVVHSALTLLQPYASAIAIGQKRVENRPWRRTIGQDGSWFALHAGRGDYPRADDLVEEWREPGGIWRDAPDLAAMPRGALLGVMHVARIARHPDAQP